MPSSVATSDDMFSEDPEITAQVEIVKTLARHMQRGDTLTWEQLEAALSMSRTNGRFRYVVNKWRRDLRKHQHIETWPIHSVGIRLLRDEENITILANKRARKARRQHNLVLKAMQNTRLDHLSTNQRLQLIAVIDHSREARRQSGQVATYSGNISNDRSKLLERLQRDRHVNG